MGTQRGRPRIPPARQPFFGRTLLLLIGFLASTYPLLQGQVRPLVEIPAVLSGTDPLLQCAVLSHSLRHLPWSEAFWHAPWFWPAPWTKVLMDPLLGQATLVTALPFVRSHPAWAYNAVIVLTLAASFVATLAVARRLGLGRPGAILAAWVYCVGPYAASHVQHLNQLPGPWLPLALLAWLALRRARGWGTLGPGALLASSLIAQLVSSLYGAAALGLLLVALVPTLGRRVPTRWVALGAALGLGIAAAWLWSLPWQQALEGMSELERGAADVGPFAARPFDFLHPPVAHLLPWPAPLPGRPSLYAGLLWPLFALWGFWEAGRRGDRGVVIALGIAALASFVLAFGRSLPVPGAADEIAMPYAWLQDALWPLRALRAPARFAVVAHLAMALLGAWAVQTLLRRRVVSPLRGGVLVLVGLALVDLLPGSIGRVRVGPNADEVLVIEQLRGLERPSPWILLPTPCTETQERPSDARAMLWAVLAEQPLAGGSAGAVPEVTRAVRERCCGELDRECTQWLLREGISWAVLPAAARVPEGWAVQLRTSEWTVAQPGGE